MVHDDCVKIVNIEKQRSEIVQILNCENSFKRSRPRRLQTILDGRLPLVRWLHLIGRISDDFQIFHLSMNNDSSYSFRRKIDGFEIRSDGIHYSSPSTGSNCKAILQARESFKTSLLDWVLQASLTVHSLPFTQPSKFDAFSFAVNRWKRMSPWLQHCCRNFKTSIFGAKKFVRLSALMSGHQDRSANVELWTLTFKLDRERKMKSKLDKVITSKLKRSAVSVPLLWSSSALKGQKNDLKQNRVLSQMESNGTKMKAKGTKVWLPNASGDWS